MGSSWNTGSKAWWGQINGPEGALRLFWGQARRREAGLAQGRVHGSSCKEWWRRKDFSVGLVTRVCSPCTDIYYAPVFFTNVPHPQNSTQYKIGTS